MFAATPDRNEADLAGCFSFILPPLPLGHLPRGGRQLMLLAESERAEPQLSDGPRDIRSTFIGGRQTFGDPGAQLVTDMRISIDEPQQHSGLFLVAQCRNDLFVGLRIDRGDIDTAPLSANPNEVATLVKHDLMNSQ